MHHSGASRRGNVKVCVQGLPGCLSAIRRLDIVTADYGF
jgi:hypothetical protein